jgi:hypothetical protein
MGFDEASDRRFGEQAVYGRELCESVHAFTRTGQKALASGL